VISSNDPKKVKTNSGAEQQASISWAVQENLDSLVEMIDADVEVVGDSSENEESMNKENEEEKKESLFSRIFSRNADNSWSDATVVDSGSVLIEKDIDENWEVSRNELIGVAGWNNGLSGKNIGKKSWTNTNNSFSSIQKYAPEILGNSEMYPWIDLDTKIGNSYEIWVHSLKLNNKYFNETLAYMLQGDSVKQLSEENSYGCFEVEILNSVLTHNIGKTWYVCKKYLKEISEESSIVMLKEVVEEKVEVSSKIWDFILVEKENAILRDIVLEVGDIIDQMTQADNQGCFMAHVYYSKNTANLGKIGSVCVSDIY
jgi:hypothetical protein